MYELTVVKLLLLKYTVFLLGKFGIMHKTRMEISMINRFLVLCISMLVPIWGWANCSQYDATEVTALQLVKGDQVLWQSSPRLVVASEVKGTEILCFVQQKHNKIREKRIVIELGAQPWLVEFDQLEQVELPISVNTVVAPFAVRGVKATCEKLPITLSEMAKIDLEGCLADFKGVYIRLITVPLTPEQQQEVKDAKPFWQFDKADEKAKKRMKKL